LEEFIPTNQTDVKMDAIKIENKDLKVRIAKIKEELTVQERSSKTAINKIYELKDEEKRTLAKSSHSITASLKELKSASLTEINEL
jgi:predicted nucleotide-binding protein (sugar kinase/HSP70/actin superfamily)